MSGIAVTSLPSATMTSREIASLTGKRHPDVTRDIESMLADLREDVSKYARIYSDSMNRDQTEYALDRELTDTLLTGYSAILRRKVIARWRELEAAPGLSLPNFADPVAAARAWADTAEAKQVLQVALDAAAPAVEFVQRYVDSTGLMGFRQAAKALKVKEPEFREFLKFKKIMYPLGGAWTAYAEHLEAGRLKTTVGTSESGRAFNSARFTPKGIAWVAGELAKWQLECRSAIT